MIKNDRPRLTLAQARMLKPGIELVDWDGKRVVVRSTRLRSPNARTLQIIVDGSEMEWGHGHFSLPTNEDRERWAKKDAEKAVYAERQAEIARVEQAFGVRATRVGGGFRWNTWTPEEYHIHLQREDVLRLLPLLEAATRKG